MARFPTRTLVLMAMALLAFVWMWWQTHRAVTPHHALPGVQLVEGAAR